MTLGDTACSECSSPGDREEPCGLCGILLGPTLSINITATDTKGSHTTLSPSANETEIETPFTTSDMNQANCLLENTLGDSDGFLKGALYNFLVP